MHGVINGGMMPNKEYESLSTQDQIIHDLNESKRKLTDPKNFTLKIVTEWDLMRAKTKLAKETIITR